MRVEVNFRQSRLARPQEIELAKSYSQLQAQIQKLQAEAEAIKAQELDGVIARIRTAIVRISAHRGRRFRLMVDGISA